MVSYGYGSRGGFVGGKGAATKAVDSIQGRPKTLTYPIHSSGGGRFGGLTHSGDWRRNSRKSAEYRSAMMSF